MGRRGVSMKLKIKEGRRRNEWGSFCPKTGQIMINPEATSNKRLETFIHEALHQFSPNLTEKQVRIYARALKNALWQDGYRRIYK